MTLEGGGLVDLPRADRPLVFTEPASLSFEDLNVNRRSDSRALVVRVTDAGDGAGTWQVRAARRRRRRPVRRSTCRRRSSCRPAARPTSSRSREAARTPRPARTTASSCCGAARSRARFPYEFFVGRPAARAAAAEAAREVPAGRHGQRPNRVSAYCCPAAPFGPPPDYVGPTDGRDRHGDALRHEHRQARRQPRRRGRGVERRVARSTRGSSARPTSATCRATPARRST